MTPLSTNGGIDVPDKPLPVIDDDSRPYWDGARVHRLMIQRCGGCARAVFYPRSICPHCGGLHLAWVEAAGTGTVHSYTVARRPAGPAFVDDVPLVVALVELDEGVRVLSNVRAQPEQMTIGARVRVWFDQVSPEVTLPKFELPRLIRLLRNAYRFAGLINITSSTLSAWRCGRGLVGRSGGSGPRPR